MKPVLNKIVVECNGIGNFVNEYRASEIISLAVIAKIKNLDFDAFLSDMLDRYCWDEYINHNDVFNIVVNVFTNFNKDNLLSYSEVNFNNIFVDTFNRDSIILGRVA